MAALHAASEGPDVTQAALGGTAFGAFLALFSLYFDVKATKSGDHWGALSAGAVILFITVLAIVGAPEAGLLAFGGLIGLGLLNLWSNAA